MRRSLEQLERRDLLAADLVPNWSVVDRELGRLYSSNVILEAGEEAREEDALQLELSQGDWLSWRAVNLSNDGNSVPAFELRDPAGDLVGQSLAAPRANAQPGVELPVTGSYEIRYELPADSEYRLELFVNALFEAERYGGEKNNSPATAVDLGPLLSEAVSSTIVHGHLSVESETVFREGFDDGLSDRWELSVTGGGQTRITALEQHQLRLDSPSGEGTVEAILPIDVSDVGAPFLHLGYATQRNDDARIRPSLPKTFTGSVDGNGVSVTTNNEVWHRIEPRGNANLENTMRQQGLDANELRAIKVQFATDDEGTLDATLIDHVRISDAADWYQFDTSPSNVISIVTTGGRVEVFNEALEQLAVVDDTLTIPASLAGSDESMKLFVRVTGDPYDYLLTISKNVERTVEQEEPWALEPATELATDGTYFGQLGSANIVSSVDSISGNFTAIAANSTTLFTVTDGTKDSLVVYNYDGVRWQPIQALSSNVQTNAKNLVATDEWIFLSNPSSIEVFHLRNDRWWKLHVVDAVGDKQRAVTSMAFVNEQLIVGTTGSEGAVTIYELTDSWEPIQELQVSEPQRRGAGFGTTIAVTDDTLFVGASGAGIRSGWVSIYTKDAGQWQFASILEAPDDAHQFGQSLAALGSTLAVGDSTVQASGYARGAVFLYEQNERQDWNASDVIRYDAFDSAAPLRVGRHLAFNDGRLFAFGIDESNSPVFERQDGDWKEVFRLGSEPNDRTLEASFSDQQAFLLGPSSVRIYDAARDYRTFTLDSARGAQIKLTALPDVAGKSSLNGTPTLELFDTAGAPIPIAAQTQDASLVLELPAGTELASGEYLIRVQSSLTAFPPHPIPYRIAIEAGLRPAPTPLQVRPMLGTARSLSADAPFVIQTTAAIAATSLERDDIRINGEAVDGMVLYGDEIHVDAELRDGAYELTIDAGSFHSVDGQPVEAFSTTVMVDATPARFLGTSLTAGVVLPHRQVHEFSLRFNEPMHSWARVYACHVAHRERCIGARSLGATGDTTISFSLRPPWEGEYEMRLVSAYDLFENETILNQTVPFQVDANSIPLTFQADGTWEHLTRIRRGLISPQDVDDYLFNVPEDSLISFDLSLEERVGVPVPNQRPIMKVVSPRGDVIYEARHMPDELINVRAADAGQYRLIIQSDSTTEFDFSGNIRLNDFEELEGRSEARNDVPESAEYVDPVWRRIGSSRFASLRAERNHWSDADVDWYRFSLSNDNAVEGVQMFSAQVSMPEQIGVLSTIPPTFELYDANTQELIEASIPNQDLAQQIAISQLPVGEYLIRVSHAGFNYRLNLVENGSFSDSSRAIEKLPANTAVYGSVAASREESLMGLSLGFVSDLRNLGDHFGHNVSAAPLEFANDYAIATTGDHILIGGSASSSLEEYTHDGELIRLLPNVYGPISGLATDGERLFVASGDKIFVCDYRTGAIESTIELGDDLLVNDVAVRSSTLYFAAGDTVYSLSDDGNKRFFWSDAGNVIRGIAFLNDLLHVADESSMRRIDANGNARPLHSFGGTSLSGAEAIVGGQKELQLDVARGSRIRVTLELSTPLDGATIQLLAPDGETVLAEAVGQPGRLDLYLGPVERSGRYRLRITPLPGQVGPYIAALDSSGREFDFDRSRQLDATDIDLLAAAIRDSDPDRKFDLNNDLKVDSQDYVAMLERVMFVPVGDVNLDGEFDSRDLVLTLQDNRYEQEVDATWATGDWNGDGRFTSADLVWAISRDKRGVI